jgi:pyridoxamine 5'-phosphate oxidase
LSYAYPMTNDSHPFDIQEILHLCWQHLAQGTKDRRSGFHYPVLSTVDAAGKPKSRVVILREADLEKRILRFNADTRTLKWNEIARQSAVSLVFYDQPEKIQLRVEGIATLHTRDVIAEKAWEGSQRMSRLGYCSEPGPGAVITSPEEFKLPGIDDDSSAGFANFGTVIVEVTSIEWLYLKVRGNRRVLFDFTADTAQWLVP